MLWNQSRRLYVAEFKNGVIKIGITKQPQSRLYSLALRFGPISRHHIGGLHECGFWAEQQVINRMRRIACAHKGREWFTGIRFKAACVLIDQVTRQAHAITAKEQAAQPA